MLRKNCITVDLNAIVHNWKIMKAALPVHTEVIAVMKANAYGHGVLQVSRALEAAGAKYFAVATPDEAIELREGGVRGEIIILGAATPAAYDACIRHHFCQTVFQTKVLFAIDRRAEELGTKAKVHIKIDTGMNRIGLRNTSEALEMASAMLQCSHTEVCGIYTHFCDADAQEVGINDFTRHQLQQFEMLRACFPKEIPTHAANSAIALNCPQAYFDMVREGISLYGYPPVKTELPFIPAMKWVSEITYIKSVLPGETIGYARTYTANTERRIATVCVGYGDGYHRSLSNRGSVLVRGRRAPIVGNVCMDQLMIDVTDIPDALEGDEVVLLGTQDNGRISAYELAEWAGTIPYEVILSATDRVERKFIPFNPSLKG